MEEFGYLEESVNGAQSLRLESVIEDALSELQRIAQIPITGKLDNETRNVLKWRRCGLKDTSILKKQHQNKRRHKMIRYKRNSQIYKWNKPLITYR